MRGVRPLGCAAAPIISPRPKCHGCLQLRGELGADPINRILHFDESRGARLVQGVGQSEQCVQTDQPLGVENAVQLSQHVFARLRLAYLSNLYVEESARGGTGTRLLEAALDACRVNRIDRVVLWPSARSVTLYSSHGFARGGAVMELKLG